MPHSIEACYGSKNHCLSHNEDEPAEGDRYCTECWHMYVTAQDLLDAHNAMMLEMLGPNGWSDGDGLLAVPTLSRELYAPETDPDQVYSCPLCWHDW